MRGYTVPTTQDSKIGTNRTRRGAPFLCFRDDLGRAPFVLVLWESLLRLRFRAQIETTMNRHQKMHMRPYSPPQYFRLTSFWTRTLNDLGSGVGLVTGASPVC